jgi:hypothetical protein
MTRFSRDVNTLFGGTEVLRKGQSLTGPGRSSLYAIIRLLSNGMIHGLCGHCLVRSQTLAELVV